MEIAVQWFAHYAVEQGVLTPELCLQFAEVLDDDIDILGFAQAILDHEVWDDMDVIQELVNQAHTQAQAGAAPPRNFFEAAAPEAAPAAAAPTIIPAGPPPPADAPSLAGIESMSTEECAALLEQLLLYARGQTASDLHISAGSPPFMRAHLELQMLSDEPLDADAALKLNTSLLTPEQLEEFEKTQDLDFAITLGETNRLRVNLMMQKDGAAGTYRLVPQGIQTLDELGFTDPKTIRKLLDHHNGLILVTGPVGSGKTVTLAALLDHLNTNRHDHIITVEEPLEIQHPSKQCQVTHREVGRHTDSFAAALKAALREDPDIIIIGELRDLETIEMAITAAETGHLVIGTLHTSDAITTLNRLLDVFPPAQQAQIRSMTGESLRGIICQRLLPAAHGGLVVGVEVLINTIAVANIVRDGKMFQLGAVIQTGTAQGMRTMDVSVLELFERGLITEEVAANNLVERDAIERIRNRHAKIVVADEPEQEEGEEAPAQKKKGWFG